MEMQKTNLTANSDNTTEFSSLLETFVFSSLSASEKSEVYVDRVGRLLRTICTFVRQRPLVAAVLIAAAKEEVR